MRPVAKLGITMLVKTSIEALVYRNLIPRIASIILLLILSLTLLGVCGVILAYRLYLALTHYGLTPEQALTGLSVGFFMLSGISGVIALRKFNALQAQLQPLLPVKEKILSAANAFIQGVNTPSK